MKETRSRKCSSQFHVTVTVKVDISVVGVFCCTVQLVVYAVPFFVTGGAELETKSAKLIVRRSSNLSWASVIASDAWELSETNFV